MEPEKKVKLEIEDVYVFEIRHWDCDDVGNCSCLSQVYDRFEKGWNVSKAENKDGSKYTDEKKIMNALFNVASSLPSWSVRVSRSAYNEEELGYEGSIEYLIHKFTGVRQSIVDCFDLLRDPTWHEEEDGRLFYMMDPGWLPLVEHTSHYCLRLSDDEELYKWIADTKDLARKYV